MRNFTSVSTKALAASLKVSYLIAKTKKPHSGESLVLPAFIKIVSIMHGESYANELKTIPLLRDTVSCRIENMSDNIKSQLLNRLLGNYFAMQLDESMDITNLSQLLVYVRYIYKNKIEEDFLFCQPLEGRTTGNDIFVLINNFLEINEIPWSMCVSICTDGAGALTGSKKDFKVKVLEVSSNIMFNHCMIHREALVFKELQPDVNKVLINAMSVIHFIKSKSLNSRLFTILCNEMGSDHKKLLLHTEVRWLSRGKILSRLFELKDEARIFLLERNNKLSEHFLDEQWLAILGYLADIFEKLNCLNLSLQGKNTNIYLFLIKSMLLKRKFFCAKIISTMTNLKCFHVYQNSSVIMMWILI